jgi:hypothetical protein
MRTSVWKAFPPNVVKPELLKMMSLQGNQERQFAYQVARLIRNANELLRWSAQAKEDSRLSEWWESTCHIVGLHVCTAENPSRLLELVVKALDGKPSKFDLKPIGLDIIKAWYAAYHIAGRTGNGFNPFAVPTLLEIKTQYAIAQRREPPSDLVKRRKWIAGLERDKQIPSDQTFRNTLKLVKLPYKKDNRSRVTT